MFIDRRKFIAIIIAVFGAIAVGMFSFNSTFLRKIFYKIQNRINPPSGPKPDNEREEASLPKEGVNVSVETALNSRCTSDYDDNPRLFHWGMFDKTKKLSRAQVEQIIVHAKIPRFTEAKIEIQNDKNMLTFTIDNRVTGSLRDRVMVESGMQQQAIGLACAAFGAGHVFSTLSVEGRAISTDEFATVRMKLDAMKPAYGGSYWSSDAPLKPSSWKSGTLPDPVRNGTKPLLAALKEVKITNNNGRQISAGDISQLLWAARGRTPHYYKSDPWGMTIPTYQGNSSTGVFYISDGNVSRYINWKGSRPAHSLEEMGRMDDTLEKLLSEKYKLNTCFIVLNRNENYAKSLWEIGYQMLNLLLQAFSLGIKYQAVLLNNNQKELFSKIGINNPVALLAF